MTFLVGEWVLLKESEWDDELHEIYAREPQEPAKVADVNGDRIRLWCDPNEKWMSPWFPAKNWKLAADHGRDDSSLDR